VIEPCEEGLECRILPPVPGEDDAFICMPSEDEDLADDETCRAFYSRDVHQAAIDGDISLNLGIGAGITAVASGTLETGVVYGGDNGCYGCYLSECIGVETNLGIEVFATVGLYNSYSDFQGESWVVVGQAGEIVSFFTGDAWNTSGDFIGTFDGLSFGVSVSPVSVGGFNCVTTTDTVGCLDGSDGNYGEELVEVVNNSPTAICAAATVCAAAPANCRAGASINNGSFDVDGDALTLTQNPAAPYAIGTRSVQLKAEDPFGGMGFCNANVTVNDCDAPGVTCPAPVIVECQSNSQASATLGAPSAVDCSSVSFTDTQRSAYPLGTTTVSYTGTDSFSNSASCSTSVTVQDTTAPAITCPADDYETLIPGQCSDDRSYVIGTSDSCDVAPVINCVDQNGVAVDPSGHSYPVGTTVVTCTSTDDSGNQSQCNFDVDLNDPPIVTPSPATQTVQYSDLIADVTLTGTDCGDDNLTLFTSALPGGTSIGGASCGPDNGGVLCTWTMSGAIAEPEADYDVNVYVNDNWTPHPLDSATETVTISVDPEDAVVIFDTDNPVSVEVESDGGNSGFFELKFDVKELVPDVAAPGAALPGDIGLADVSMDLVPVGPGGPVVGACLSTGVDITGSSYDDTLHVACLFDDVPVNAYSVQVTVNLAGYYIGSGEDVLVVYDPSLGFTTGGFKFNWPETGDRTTGGYTMKYNKKQTKVQGSLLLIRHLPDGTKYRIKSNALFGLALGDGGSFGWASFSGKSTYLEPGWIDAKGNHQFVVYVEDHGEPGTGVDQFWLEVKDKDGNILDGLSLDRPATSNSETLTGGNIVVPHKIGKRR